LKQDQQVEKSLKNILENTLVKLLSHGRSGIPFPTPELGETFCLFGCSIRRQALLVLLVQECVKATGEV